jgi:mRNA interferase MazF
MDLSMKMKINRSEVWLIDLNPVIGHEQSGIRPALVVSDDLFNHSPAEMVIVLPITGKFRGLRTHIELNGDYLKQKSFIKTEDIRSVSIHRLIKKIGQADESVIKAIEERLKYLLGFA